MKTLILLLTLAPHLALADTAHFTMTVEQQRALPFTKEQCQKDGRVIPDGDIPSPMDLGLDSFCAEDLMHRAAPTGFVAVFGSAQNNLPALDYKLTEEFAAKWTRSQLGGRAPIATAGGPGMMLAANRGALEAGKDFTPIRHTLAFPTHFGPLGAEHGEPLVSRGTDGRADFYQFSSFSQRETEMIDRSVATVVAPGGIGTAWEILETMTKIQTGKKKPSPIILLGKESDWAPLMAMLNQMVALGTIKKQHLSLVQVVGTADEAVQIIQDHLATEMRQAQGLDSSSGNGGEVVAGSTAGDAR